MSEPLWMLPDAEPVGPWIRARGMLWQMPAGRLPYLVFRSKPDVQVLEELDGLKIKHFSLGNKGLNPVAIWWRLRGFLKDQGKGRIHVWDLADLPVTVLATQGTWQISCEVSEGQEPPRLFRWWKNGLDQVSHWFCQGRVPWLESQKVKEVGGWTMPSSGNPTLSREVASELPVMLVADSSRAVREGLWAFDIFKHAWPAARLTILASPSVLEAAKGFAGTLGLGAGVTFLSQWAEADALQSTFAVVVLGSGPWVGDAALGALSWGGPVLAEESSAIHRAIIQGAPLLPVPPGDRAGLAAALQKIALGKKEGPIAPRTVPAHLSAARDLCLYVEVLD